MKSHLGKGAQEAQLRGKMLKPSQANRAADRGPPQACTHSEIMGDSSEPLPRPHGPAPLSGTRSRSHVRSPRSGPATGPPEKRQTSAARPASRRLSSRTLCAPGAWVLSPWATEPRQPQEDPLSAFPTLSSLPCLPEDPGKWDTTRLQRLTETFNEIQFFPESGPR